MLVVIICVIIQNYLLKRRRRFFTPVDPCDRVVRLLFTSFCFFRFTAGRTPSRDQSLNPVFFAAFLAISLGFRGKSSLSVSSSVSLAAVFLLLRRLSIGSLSLVVTSLALPDGKLESGMQSVLVIALYGH